MSSPEDVDYFLDDRLNEALTEFDAALKHDPNLAEVHYSQGSIYEQILDLDRARSEYQRAMLGGVAAAYNNMARLCILEGNYGNASELIQRGLRLAKSDEIKVQYALLKNLGWLRLLQERYTDSKEALQRAIELHNQQASVHCLLAQIYEAEKELTKAQKEWESCLHYARDDHPDEDIWIAMAQKRLASSDDRLS